MYRKDRNLTSGGLWIYIKSSIPSRRLSDLGAKHIDTFAMEIRLKIKSSCLFIIPAYKPPDFKHETFLSELSNSSDRAIINYSQISIIRVLNSNICLETRTNSPLVLFFHNQQLDSERYLSFLRVIVQQN